MTAGVVAGKCRCRAGDRRRVSTVSPYWAGSASQWNLPSSLSWPDDCFLCLDDDANCGREDQQLGDARRVDREDHVWTDRSGLDSPKALLTSRIKTGAIDRHESTASHVLACVFSRKEAA